MATDKLVDFDHVTDYIGRERASDLLEQALIEEWEPEYAQDRLSEIPAADVRPVVRGRWIDGKCDQCGEHAPYWCMASTYHTTNFCPNCGADMREDATK